MDPAPLPKNNLADVRRRKASGAISSVQTYTPPPRPSSHKSKFKPAALAPNLPAPRPTKPLSRTTTTNNNNGRSHAQDDTSLSPKSPLKRTSSNPTVISDPSPQAFKRSKNTEKENTLVATQKQASPPGFIARLAGKATALDTPEAPHLTRPEWMGSHSDLMQLSSEGLQNYRIHHHELLTHVMQQLLDGTGPNEVDTRTLQPFRKTLEERLRAIKWVEAQRQSRHQTIDLPSIEPQNDVRMPVNDDEQLWAAFEDAPAHPVINHYNHIDEPSDEIRKQLKDVFGLSRFRPNQLEAIKATMEGKDVFLLMPTGGGKSLCYQLPAVCSNIKSQGVTVVVSPLTALMEDQVSALTSRGINAFYWSADSPQHEVNAKLWSGDKKPALLYLTPEKIKASPACRNLLLKLYNQGQLARFAIDEAHCISTWGQDFRSAYQGLGQLREDYPKVPIIALTATANQCTREDIVTQLKLRDHAFFTQSFNRPNLKYFIKAKKKKNMLPDIVEFIKKEHPNHTGVIYCLARKSCQLLAEQLQKEGVAADFFHAGLSKEEKNRLLESWKADKFHVMVATIAFGMGIDKADVRFVIHHDLPKSLSGYYQETGRAGRDGKLADCVLYYWFPDFKKICWMIDQDKEREEVLTPEAKKRQKDAAREVVKYCTNISECRRVQVLRHFGQEFNQHDCKAGCDNCLDKRQPITEDVTVVATNAIDVVRSLSDKGQQITQRQLTEVLRGANSNMIQDHGFSIIEGYGTCKNLSRELVDIALDRLILLEVLAISLQKQKTTFSAEYLEIGSAAQNFKAKGQCLQVKWRPPTVKNIIKPVTVEKQKGKRRGRNSRSHDDDPIEAFPDEAGPSNISVDAMGELYTRLDGLRHQIATREGLSNEIAVMSNALVESLCYSCPRDFFEFQQIIDNAPNEYSPSFDKYRDEILQVCIQHQLSTTRKLPLDIKDVHDRFVYDTTSTMPGTGTPASLAKASSAKVTPVVSIRTGAWPLFSQIHLYPS